MKRPLGVSILAVLHMIGGGLLCLMVPIVALAAIAGGDDFSGALGMIGMSPALLIAAMTVLATLVLASGIGMWIGKAWAYPLATFYYANRIVSNTAAAIMFANNDALALMVENTERPLEYYIVKHAGRAVVSFLILLYLMSPRPVHFFGVSGSRRWLSVSIGVAVGLAMLAL